MSDPGLMKQVPGAEPGLFPAELATLVEEARAKGSIRLPGTDDAFVVVPRYGRQVLANPFQTAGNILEPPRARAAYSDRTAWLMAALSKLAYEPYETKEGREALITALAQGNLMLVETLNEKETDTQGFLALRDGAFAVLVFRGTETNRKDIISDINARFFNTPEGRAHAGFTKGYQSVDGLIRTSLDLIGEEHMPQGLFVAGHSLGGALATVATQDLEESYLVAACYTFGSPRVGVAEWSDSVKTPVYRVLNGADAVPMVPFSAVIATVLNWLPHLPMLQFLRRPVDWIIARGFLGYQHVGDVRYLCGTPEEAQLKSGSAASWARFRHVLIGCFWSAVKSLSPNGLSALFADHAIRGYVERLRTVAERRNVD